MVLFFLDFLLHQILDFLDSPVHVAENRRRILLLLLHLVLLQLVMILLQGRVQLRGDEQTRCSSGDGWFVVVNRGVGIAVDAVSPITVKKVHPNVLRRAQLRILKVAVSWEGRGGGERI